MNRVSVTTQAKERRLALIGFKLTQSLPGTNGLEDATKLGDRLMTINELASRIVDRNGGASGRSPS